MIIFLYGPDTYRSQQKLKEIVERYKKIRKSGLNLKYFDGSDLSFQNFKDEFRTISMFAEKKLFVVKNVFSNSGFKEKFSESIIFFRKSNDIILIYEKEVPQNDLLFKALKKNSKSQEFNLLEGYKLKNWIQKEFERYNAEIRPQALEKLIQFVGNDLWQMSQEIKKLVSYKCKSKYQNVEISSKDIKLLVKSKIDTNIFKTIDAIAMKNKKLALNLIHQHLEKGDSPFYLFSMLNFQFRNLLMIKSRYQYTNAFRMTRIGNLSKGLDMHPYVARKALWQSEKFSLDEIKKIYQGIFQADLAIKTGRISPIAALDMLIAEL